MFCCQFKCKCIINETANVFQNWYIFIDKSIISILFSATQLPLGPESDEFGTIKAWICQARSLSGSGFMGIFPGILNNSKVEEIWRHEVWLVSDMNTTFKLSYHLTQSLINPKYFTGPTFKILSSSKQISYNLEKKLKQSICLSGNFTCPKLLGNGVCQTLA